MDDGKLERPTQGDLPSAKELTKNQSVEAGLSPVHSYAKKCRDLLLKLYTHHVLETGYRKIRIAGIYLIYAFPGLLLMLLTLVFYWPFKSMIVRLYSLHMELTGLIFVALVVAASVGALKIVQRLRLVDLLHEESEDNAVVTTLVTVAGFFFALVMAVIATGVWDNFKRVSETVAQESQSAESLYRNLESYQIANRKHFQDLLKTYIHQVIDIDWKSQMVGIDPGSNKNLDALTEELLEFDPGSPRERLLYSDTVAELGRLQAYRHARRHAVSLALPPVLWPVVFVGASLSIGMVYMLKTKNAKLHAILVALLGAVVGIVLFLVLAMDHPLWGELSVSKEPFENLLKGWR